LASTYPDSFVPPKGKKSPTRSSWLTLVLSAFVLLDLVVYCYFAYTVLAPPGSIDDLELRNSYINMAELYESGLVSSSLHLPILNLPRVASQVYAAEPHRLAPQDEHSRLTPYGRMAIPDHHLQVTKDVSDESFRCCCAADCLFD
jgi:hypothetical protein